MKIFGIALLVDQYLIFEYASPFSPAF